MDSEDILVRSLFVGAVITTLVLFGALIVAVLQWISGGC
jgi:hypothetical protein